MGCAEPLDLAVDGFGTESSNPIKFAYSANRHVVLISIFLLLLLFHFYLLHPTREVFDFRNVRIVPQPTKLSRNRRNALYTRIACRTTSIDCKKYNV